MSSAAITTKVNDLGDCRLKVEVQVPAVELQKKLSQTAKALGKSMKLPGFRKGKVPPELVIRNLGREMVLNEAVRDHLGTWYIEAVQSAQVNPVGAPEIEIGDLPAGSQGLDFSFEVNAVPEAKLGVYQGLEVAKREVEIADERIQQQLELLQKQLAKLEVVDRAIQAGDFASISYFPHDPLAEGQLKAEPKEEVVEIGSGRLPVGFEEQLVGMKASESGEVKIAFPDDYPNSEYSGKEIEFSVDIREVRERILPELNDELAQNSLGISTLEELRAEIMKQLLEGEQREAEVEFRNAALDAVTAKAQVQLTDQIIEARAKEFFEQSIRSLQRQGIDKNTYLKISGKTEAELIDEAKESAEQSLKREAVIYALVKAEGIDPTDEDLVTALADAARENKVSPEKLLKQLKKRGELEEFRKNVAAQKAWDFIVEQAKPISQGQAEAKEKLWTPDKEK